MIAEAGTFQTMAMFLMVLPHEATLCTSHNQRTISARARVCVGGQTNTLKGLWTKTINSNFMYSIGSISTAYTAVDHLTYLRGIWVTLGSRY
jgi:hypothetical protein